VFHYPPSHCYYDDDDSSSSSSSSSLSSSSSSSSEESLGEAMSRLNLGVTKIAEMIEAMLPGEIEEGSDDDLTLCSYMQDNPRWKDIATENDLEKDGIFKNDGYCHFSRIPPSHPLYDRNLLKTIMKNTYEIEKCIRTGYIFVVKKKVFGGVKK